MTQIVLHPRNVARFGPYGGARVMLGPPWMWWETRVYTNDDGNALVIRCEPEAESIRDYFVTFGPDRDRVVLTDPPAMFLIHIQEVQNFDDGLRGRVLLTNSFVTARVVWWCQPGPGWQPVPHVRTCRPGEYVQDSHTRGIGRDRDQERRERDWSDAFYEPMPALDWPRNPMIVDGQSVASSVALTGDRCRQCQRYMTESERGTTTEIRNWGGDLIAVLQDRYQSPLQNPLCPDCRAMQAAILTPNEIREREGLPPIPDATGYIQPGRQLDLSPPRPMRRPNVLPERDVVDEIDRLVNDQVRHGPVDDYQVNRFPKCKHCPHQWHGLPCEQCTCLGELEDPV